MVDVAEGGVMREAAGQLLWHKAQVLPAKSPHLDGIGIKLVLRVLLKHDSFICSKRGQVIAAISLNPYHSDVMKVIYTLGQSQAQQLHVHGEGMTKCMSAEQ